MSDRFFVLLILIVQIACAAFFLSDIVLTMFGIRSRPISWQSRELLEIGAGLGLILGVGLGAAALQRTMKRQRLAEERLRRASGVFMDLLNERFDDWGRPPPNATWRCSPSRG